MAALTSLLAILIVSNLVTRIATVALVLTGVSRDIARFQALSAFTGAGFTTSESENIIDHPVRRRIIAMVIRLGGVGLVTTLASFILTFVSAANSTERLLRAAILVSTLLALWLVTQIDWVDKKLSQFFEQLLLNRWTDQVLMDYEALLSLSDGYRVDDIIVRGGAWLADKKLREVRLRDEGVMVLGIRRKNGEYVGAPYGDTRICPGDELILYGQAAELRELEERLAGASGESKHHEAVADHADRLEEQQATDSYSQREAA